MSLGQPEELDTERFFRSLAGKRRNAFVAGNASYGWRVQYALSYDDYYVWALGSGSTGA